MRTTVRLISILLVTAATGCEASPPSATGSATSGPSPSAASTSAGPDSATPSPMPVPSATSIPPAETAFGAPTDRSKNGHLRLSTVLSSNGSPLVGAPVTVTITALDETYQVIRLKGIVPVETKAANVGFRFNEEGAGPARIDLSVYQITYADGGNTKNRVTNSDFSSGFYAWGLWGSGKATVQNSDRDDGRMLRLRASHDENIGINSIGLQHVTPGANFTLTVRAKLPPAGTATGYASAFFLWGKDALEGHRLTIPLVAPPIPAVDLVTADDGDIALDLALPAGRYAISLAYRGDASHHAATIEQQITVP